MNEKLIRSFISGLAGGVVKDIVDTFFYYVLHFGNYRYLDFAAEIIYGEKPTFWWDTTFAQFIELIFCGLLGVLYYVLIPEETNKNYLLKDGSTEFPFGCFYAPWEWYSRSPILQRLLGKQRIPTLSPARFTVLVWPGRCGVSMGFTGKREN